MPYALSSTAITVVRGQPWLPGVATFANPSDQVTDISGFAISASLTGPGGTVTPTVAVVSAAAGTFAPSMTAQQTAGIALGQLSMLTYIITDPTGNAFVYDIPVNGVAP